MEMSSEFGLITGKGAHIPLTSVDVSGDIIGRGALLSITQIFANQESGPVEAVYRFPLPESSAVCAFSIRAGDRVVEGKVEEYDEAFREYDDAIIDGNGAYLLDEERPNIFTLSVGNLNPGMKAAITVRFVTMLECRGDSVRFFLPTTISPRYVPAGTYLGRDIPVSDRVNPPVDSDVPYGMRMMLRIHDRDGIASIESPTHRIRTNIGSNPVEVEFSSDEIKMDRDFVLNVKRKNQSFNKGYLLKDEKGKFIQIDFSPALDREELSSETGSEIVFLLDCSGSMSGDSIERAKNAIGILLKGLDDKKSFNIYRFGSSFESLFSGSVPYSEKNVRKATEYISRIDADLGGTEILMPLRDIYSKALSREKGGRNIVIITDGQVGNEGEILALIRKHTGQTRVFTVGIGYGPNEYFLREIARTTGGTSELIAPGEAVETRLVGIYDKITSRRITSFQVHWPGGTVQSPATPAVFHGEVISIFGRLADSADISDSISITYRINDRNFDCRIDICEIDSEDSPLPVLWARERIRDLEADSWAGSRQKERRTESVKKEIIALSKEFGVVSQETSKT
jgi:Ca-activated chloride channel family protein